MVSVIGRPLIVIAYKCRAQLAALVSEANDLRMAIVSETNGPSNGRARNGPPPGRCPPATSQPSCGHARPPAGNADRPRRPNRNSRPDRAAHRLRNSKGSGGISKARAAASSPRQVGHIRPAMGYAHNRAMCAIRSHRQRDTSPSRFGEL